MSYQSILVQLTSDRTCIDRLAFANRISGYDKKRIGGCYFQSDIIPVEHQTSEIMISPDGIAWTPGLSDDAKNLVSQDLSCVRQLIEDLASDETDLQWHTAEGELSEELNNSALTHELVVLSKSFFDGINSRRITDTLPDLSKPLSTPLFILSENTIDGYFPKNPLIIWDGDTASAKALKDALPLLKITGQCSLLSNQSGSVHQEIILLEEISALMNCHGIAVNAVHTMPDKAELSDVINEVAERNNHDVIVLGYRGDSVFKKLFGDTLLDNVLDETSLPVFLSN